VAFGLGATYIVQWELQQIGLQWSNMSQLSIPEDNLTFFTVTAILVFDIFLYMVLTWYIEGMYPGRYGVSKPWYFPFMPSYWCGQSGRGIVRRLFRRGGVRHVTLVEDGDETELQGTVTLRVCVCVCVYDGACQKLANAPEYYCIIMVCEYL
jgi:hypothetical protein